MPAANPTQIYVPVLKAFENGNTFTGSAGPLRFELSPLSETNEIRVRIWYGEYCLAKSEIADVYKRQTCRWNIASRFDTPRRLVVS